MSVVVIVTSFEVTGVLFVGLFDNYLLHTMRSWLGGFPSKSKSKDKITFTVWS